MARSDGLTIPINGDNKDFRKKMSETKGIISQAMPIAAGSIGGVLSGAAVINGINIIRQYTSDLLDLSEQSGVSVNELQKLSEVFSRQGLNLQQTFPLLDQMQKKLYEAGEGTGEAVRGLELLGLKAEQFKNKNPVEQFYMITEAMKGMDIQTKRLAATYFFGESGTRMLRVMNQGMENINKQRKEAIELQEHEIKNMKILTDLYSVEKNRATAQGSKVLDSFAEHILIMMNQGGKGLEPIVSTWEGMFSDNKTMIKTMGTLGILVTEIHDWLTENGKK